MNSSIAIVIIGRNEQKCLNATLEPLVGLQAIYVDSGSTDRSVVIANNKDIPVHQLSPDSPFTAARARNEGFKIVKKLYPDIRYVQFIDGDCELCPDWLDNAYNELEKNTEIAVLCGELKEKYPDRTIYNKLIQLEWKSLVYFTGTVIFKVEVFEEINGFNPIVIAGEDSELAARLVESGYVIKKLKIPMATHDANIHSISQWLWRTIRSGHAAADRAYIHSKTRSKDGLQELQSILIWGCIIPIVGVFSMFIHPAFLLLLISLYLLLFVKIVFYRMNTFNDTYLDAMKYSFFIVVGKTPQMLGLSTFYIRELFCRKKHIIEYK